MICYVLAIGKRHLGPHMVVGYGIKVFWPGLFITSPNHLDMAIQTLSDTASRWPYISLLILMFLNRCISVKTSLINTKLGNLVNLGVLFLTTGVCGSLVANPIIYRPVPSPSWFEIRQYQLLFYFK